MYFQEELVVAITVTQVNIAKGAMMSYEIFGYKDNIDMAYDKTALGPSSGSVAMTTVITPFHC